ncbi:RNase H domain-containing protein, partial [Trichonephila clavipes]
QIWLLRHKTPHSLTHSNVRKALARRIRRQCQRILDPVCVFNHIVNYQSTVVEKGQQRMAFIGALISDILRNPTAFIVTLDVAHLIGFHYTWTIYRSVVKVRTHARMIERQLQTAVNNILKWCDTNGHSISASKSCCVHFAANGIFDGGKLSLAYYFKILSVPSHPLQNVYMSTSMKRHDARPSNIRPFMDRMKLHISELDLPNVRIQQRNLFSYSNLGIRHLFHYINPFATYSKSTVAPVVFQRVFAYHRSQYSRYSAIYTDGSKRADYALAVES